MLTKSSGVGWEGSVSPLFLLVFVDLVDFALGAIFTCIPLQIYFFFNEAPERASAGMVN